METAKEDYLRHARKLHESSRFFLAVKAYERALDAQKVDAAFKDFVLRCNAHSVSIIGTDIKVAADYMYLCLKNLQSRDCLLGDIEGRGVVVVPNQEDMSMMFLLSVTLNNWGCVLLRLGEVEAALSVFPVALEASRVPELSHAILLNICAAQIRKCSLPEARETATSVLEELQDADELPEESVSFFEAEGARDDLRVLLSALVCHNIAIVEEFFAPNTADEYYQQAQQTLVGSPYQQWSVLMERNHRKFRAILQRRREEAVRRSEQAEAEAAAAALAASPAEMLNRRQAKGLKGTLTHSSSRGVKQNKKGHKRGSISGVEDELIELPPIDEKLQWELRSNGLLFSAVSIFSIKEVSQSVFKNEESFEEFESPFVVPGVASTANNVAMILSYEETPLQVADYMEVGCTGSVKRTIWSLYSPRHMDALYPSGRKTLSVPPAPAVVPALKSFMPPPLPDRAIENAKRTATGLEKLLIQRLTTLLRAEAAFEERWMATTMIKSALIAFNVAQDIVRLKITMKNERERQAALEDASARRIVRFFQGLCKIRQDQFGPLRNRYFDLLREKTAAIVMQKYARRWLAIKTLRALQAEHQAEIARVTTVQALYRARRVRQEHRVYCEGHRAELDAERHATEREFAAMCIQRVYRRHAWRLCSWLAAGETKTAILHHYRHSRVYYATLIQKVFRGYRVRRAYGAEAYARRCYGRNVYRAYVLHMCATHIQRVYRGYRVRRFTREPLRQRMFQRVAERVAEQWRRQEAAAVTLQCAYRSYLARRKALKNRNARERERLLRRGRVYAPFCLREQVY